MEIYLDYVDHKLCGFDLVGKTYNLGECTLLWYDKSNVRKDLGKKPGCFEIVMFRATKDEWGYKNVEEDCGPFLGNPTLKMLRKAEELDIVPSTVWGLNWRYSCWNVFKAEMPKYLKAWHEKHVDTDKLSCKEVYSVCEEHVKEHREVVGA
jgi:hypothetical protein